MIKKLTLFVALSTAGLTASAQNLGFSDVSVIRTLDFPSPALSEFNDTLGIYEFGDNALLYYDPEAGYIFGTAKVEDEIEIFPGLPPLPYVQVTHEMAAGFLVNNGYDIKGAVIYAGVQENVSGSSPGLNVKLYSLDENKAIGTSTSEEADAIGPHQLLYTQPLAFDDLMVGTDEVEATIVMFNSPVFHPEDFAISLDISAVYGSGDADTVALLANPQNFSTDGSYTWLRLSGGSPGFGSQQIWASMTAFNLPSQLAIFAIVEESVGIADAGYINGVRFNAYPNPSVAGAPVRIDYALEASAKAVELRVLDMGGRAVLTLEEGSRSAGNHTVQLPSGISPGSYILAITADNVRIAKQMQVLR